MYNQTVYLKINCFAKIQTYEQNSSKLSEIFDAYTNRSLHFQLSLSLSLSRTHTHALPLHLSLYEFWHTQSRYAIKTTDIKENS